MFRFLIILLILTLFHPIDSSAARATRKCAKLFVNDEEVKSAITSFIEPYAIKRKLYLQTVHNLNIRQFVIEFSKYLNDLYEERFADILYGSKSIDTAKTGFSSAHEARVLKEAVLHLQIKILSFMNFEDLTPEFQHDFKHIAKRMHDPTVSKIEVLNTTTRLNKILSSYKLHP